MLLRIFPKHIHNLTDLWQFLTEPSAAITAPLHRRSARMLAGILVAIIPLLLVGRFTRQLTGVPNTDPLWQSLSFVAIIAILVVSYFFSRTQHYQFGAALMVTLLSAAIQYETWMWANQETHHISHSLIWLVPVIMVSSILLSAQSTVLLIASNILAIVLLPVFVPDVTIAQIRPSTDFILVLSVLVVVTVSIRRQDLNQIQSQANELIESEERYWTLLAATFEGIALQDDGKIIDVNPEFLVLFGYDTPDEVIGRSAQDFVTVDSYPIVREKINTIDSQPYEVIGLRKDGTTFDLEVRARFVAYKSRLVRVVALRDISNRKQAEAQRIELAIERERINSMRQVIGDASHDLRTPLAGVKTSLYLLRRVMGDQEKPLRYIESLEAQTTHLERMVEDVLSMSRLDAETTGFEFKCMDLNEMLDSMVNKIQSLAVHKNLTIRFDKAADLPEVVADDIKMERAINNILSNALRYTPQDGKIVVQTYLQEGEVIIEIQDNGIGISGEDLPFIFDRFYRADKARQSETGGLGLGLAITKKIVEAHSGRVEVESNLGSGSCFRIVLPKACERPMDYEEVTA